MAIRYCPHCERATYQYKQCDSNVAERIFSGIFTLGWSETIHKHWWRCAECGRTNDKHDMFDKIIRNDDYD